jgi:hypothetical protein
MASISTQGKRHTSRSISACFCLAATGLVDTGRTFGVADGNISALCSRGTPPHSPIGRYIGFKRHFVELEDAGATKTKSPYHEPTDKGSTVCFRHGLILPFEALDFEALEYSTSCIVSQPFSA